MAQDRLVSFGQSKPVDETRVVETVAKHLIVRSDQASRHTRVELKTRREQDGIRVANNLGESMFELAVTWMVTADQPRRGRTRNGLDL